MPELIIRHIGPGMNCSNCGRNRETTAYVLCHRGEQIQRFLLCDDCRGKEFSIKFDVRKPAIPPDAKRKLVKISKSLEVGLAKEVRGRRLAGSGNLDEKGDVRVVGKWRLEHKFTDSMRTYTIDYRDLEIIERIGNAFGERPGMVITFRKRNKRFVVIPYSLFLELMEGTNVANQHRAPKACRQRTATRSDRDQQTGLLPGGHERQS